MPLGLKALHIWLPLTMGMAKRTHTFRKFLSKATSNTLKVKCINLPEIQVRGSLYLLKLSWHLLEHAPCSFAKAFCKPLSI